MAEFLIYDKDHWMDSLTPQQIAQHRKRHTNFQAHYDARYQKGDIVEVRENGGYTSTLKGDLSRWPFRVVVITNLQIDAPYGRPLVSGEEVVKKARFSIQDGDGKKVHVVSNLSDITIMDKKV
ncbi:MAG: hypothetical protein ACYTFQ_28425 [Planctomycetota bacterium]|jgi:hypothetical protein